MNAKAVGTTLANQGRAIIGGLVAPNSTILANSITVTIGDAVKSASGFLTNASVTTAAVAGIVIAVVDKNGLPIASDANTIDSYTTASDNQTNAQLYAMIDESPFTIYSFKIDNTPGTTTGSNLRNYYCDFTDKTQLSESSAATSGKVVRLLGVDPLAGTANRVLGTINKPECLRN